MLAFVALAVNAQEVTLDFTKAAEDWGITYTSSNKCKGTETFSNGTYEVTFAGDGQNGFAAYSGYVLFGKEGAYLQLPAFDFAVEKIEFVGAGGASGNTKMNVFVGDEAVSTETTGSKATNVYEIAPEYQAAGNVYAIKVTSAHNAQVTAVKVYKAELTPTVTANVSEVYLWNYAYDDMSIWYETNRKYITVTEKNFEENVALNAVMKSSGKTQGASLANSTRFTVSGTVFTQGEISIMTTSKKVGEYVDTIQLVNGADVYLEIPVRMVIVGTSDDGTFDDEQSWPFTVADAYAIHSIMPVGGNYYTDPTHEWSAYDDGIRCYKGVVTSIKGYYNSKFITFYIGDEEGAEQTLQVYNCLGLDSQAFASKDDVQVGQQVVIVGELCDYNNAPELVNPYILEIDGVTTEIAAMKNAQNTNIIYNLAGQRVNANVKGIVVVNGKKVVR